MSVPVCISCRFRQRQHDTGLCRTCHREAGYMDAATSARQSLDAAYEAYLDSLRPVRVPKAQRTIVSMGVPHDVIWDGSVRPIARAQ